LIKLISRENEGIYIFGSKKINIKLEQDKIISINEIVRIGGGFYAFDDFVRTNLNSEFQKLKK